MENQYATPIIKPHLIRQFTDAEVTDLARCKQSVYSFCSHVKVIDPVQGIINFDPYRHQKELMIKFANFRFNICLSSRQSGKTTVVAVYALWRAIFNPNQFIGIASNTFDASKDFLSRIKTVYENLPDYIKPGVISYNVSSILFDNGSKIECASTTPHTFRGRSISLLVFDEMASVDPPSMARELWASIYPTVSQGGNIIIISTPMGVGNLFYEIWTDAIYKRNNFMTTKVDWDAVPGRDEPWKQQMIADLGQVRWNREYGNQFIGSTTTVIAPDIIEQMQTTVPPKETIDEYEAFDGAGKFRVLERAMCNYRYMIGVDISKGVGQNYSVCQVFRIVTDPTANEDDHSQEWLKQVAVFSTNTISPRQFSHILYSIARNYNDAFVAIENNSEGFQVADVLWNELEYENTVNWRPKGVKKRFEPGIKATKQSKNLAITYWKQETEANKIQYFDYTTIKEISCFVEERERCFGQGSLDDHVAATYWAAWIWDLYKKGTLAFDMEALMEALRHKSGPRGQDDERKIKILKRKQQEKDGEVVEPIDELLSKDVIENRRRIAENEKLNELVKKAMNLSTSKEKTEDDTEQMMGPIFDDDPTEGGQWKDPWQM